MAAVILKNESIASARRCGLTIFAPATAQPAPRGTDFTGYVYVSLSTYKFVPAIGTLTNKRRTLEVADDVIESVDTVLDQVVMTAHVYQTGDGPFDSDEVMGPVAVGGDIYAISVDANTVAWAASAADAYAGTRIALAGTETGATISDSADTERGIDGKWQYELAAAEVTFEGTEIDVQILGHATYEGGASLNFERSGSAMWDADDGSGTGRTMADLQRLSARTAGARIIIDPVTGAYVVRNLEDSADSHGGTISATGRDDIDLSGLA